MPLMRWLQLLILQLQNKSFIGVFNIRKIVQKLISLQVKSIFEQSFVAKLWRLFNHS